MCLSSGTTLLTQARLAKSVDRGLVPVLALAAGAMPTSGMGFMIGHGVLVKRKEVSVLMKGQVMLKEGKLVLPRRHGVARQDVGMLA